MTQTNALMSRSAETKLTGRGSKATSLFGGAILATVATATLAQVTYVTSIGALGTITVASGYVVAGGYNTPGDGGGGTFMPGPSGCVSDNGLVFLYMAHNCFYRSDPTYSVREWGALCDVNVVTPPGGALWNPGTAGSTVGTLTVPTALLATTPAPNESIAISQIGSPTLWGTATPAVSLTRYTKLGGTQVNYSAGDLISFVGTLGNTGTFSQEAAIVVDAVSGGTITNWHFLWGGLYAAASPPIGTMVQDDSRSQCGHVCGPSGGQASGATLTPTWSGWSVLNSQSISNRGTGYAVGEIVTLFQPTNTIVNQGHAPQLIVESTTTLGAVMAYDWLDYGSFNTLPTPSTSLSAYSTTGVGASLTFSPVAWTQGPYASTIVNAGTVGTNTTIVVAGTAAFPGTINVQSFYYGHDDSTLINNALGAKPASALVIPARCGTTKLLNLS